MTEPIAFGLDGLEWSEEAPGVIARRTEAAGASWAIVEYAPGAGRPEFCDVAHVGYVLAGEITYAFSDGRPELLARAGEGFTLPPGAPHRGTNHGTEPARLLVLDEPYLG
jgi:quercetin dioxygenase-like cupin family protein